MKQNNVSSFVMKSILRLCVFLLIHTWFVVWVRIASIGKDSQVPTWLVTAFEWIIPKLDFQLFALVFVLAVGSGVLARKLKMKTRLPMKIANYAIAWIANSMMGCGSILISWSYVTQQVAFIEPVPNAFLLGLCFILLGAFYYLSMRKFAVYVWRNA